MPLFKHLNPNANLTIALWHITETEEELLQIYTPNETELDFFERFKSQKRLHFLASRALLAQFTNSALVEKDQFGKPHLINLPHKFSWSHSGDFAAISVHTKHETGIDIEKIGDRILKIERKFCNEMEISFLANNENRIKQLHIIWGAKESMYKFYGKKELDFKLAMSVNGFELNQMGSISATLVIEKRTMHFNLNYEFIQEHCLVYINN